MTGPGSDESGSRPAVGDLGTAGGERLAHDPVGEPSRVALALQHPDQAPGSDVRRQATRNGQPARDQGLSRGKLSVAVDLLDGEPGGDLVDALASQLGAERSPGQTATAVPGLDVG